MPAAQQQNSWQLGTMYYGGKLNGTPFFTQSAPFQPVFPQLPQGAPWPEWPGAASLVYSYAPWVGIGCLHWIHQYTIIQDYDYEKDQPVALITCPVCSYIQNAVYGQLNNGMQEIYDPYVYAVIVA